MTTNTLPADAAVIDRLGTAVLMEHFDITRQAVSYWRQKGIPRTYRKAVKLLGESLEHDMTDLTTEDD